jgi:hypothetical protein
MSDHATEGRVRSSTFCGAQGRGQELPELDAVAGEQVRRGRRPCARRGILDRSQTLTLPMGEPTWPATSE